MRKVFLPVLLSLALLFGVFIGKGFAAVSDYAGVYTGTYDGVDRGRWVINVKANGACYIGGWSDAHQMADYLIDDINANGEILYPWANGDYVYFNISLDGSAYGEFGNVRDNVVFFLGTGHKNNPDQVAAYAGSYEGAVSGDVTGTVYFKVHEDGSLSGSASIDNEQDIMLGVGTVTGGGEVFAVAEDGTVFSGSIDSSGRMSGQWQNYYWNTSGPVSATLEGAADNGDGGGGGGGCFISTLKF